MNLEGAAVAVTGAEFWAIPAISVQDQMRFMAGAGKGLRHFFGKADGVSSKSGFEHKYFC